MLEISNLRYGGQNWDRYIGDICIEQRRDKLKFMMGRMSLGATMYAIWSERNNKIYARGSQTKEMVLEKVRRTGLDEGAEFTKVRRTK